mmetsp:Transcript_17901/g.30888  ORF Transcript_17901/g.30888 Transcript_17901/m.30888 type:complete len:191 (-) Transcript_17901:226-798(-)
MLMGGVYHQQIMKYLVSLAAAILVSSSPVAEALDDRSLRRGGASNALAIVEEVVPDKKLDLIVGKVHSEPRLECAEKYTLVCGASKHPRCRGKEPQPACNLEEHPVRCCSDGKIPGWKRRAKLGCSVWAQSWLKAQNPGEEKCNDAETWAQAKHICQINGGRLCTAAEMEGNCAAGSGCGFNPEYVWVVP